MNIPKYIAMGRALLLCSIPNGNSSTGIQPFPVLNNLVLFLIISVVLVARTKNVLILLWPVKLIENPLSL